jgi:hypothetical protein
LPPGEWEVVPRIPGSCGRSKNLRSRFPFALAYLPLALALPLPLALALAFLIICAALGGEGACEAAKNTHQLHAVCLFAVTHTGLVGRRSAGDEATSARDCKKAKAPKRAR